MTSIFVTWDPEPPPAPSAPPSCASPSLASPPAPPAPGLQRGSAQGRRGRQFVQELAGWEVARFAPSAAGRSKREPARGRSELGNSKTLAPPSVTLPFSWLHGFRVATKDTKNYLYG